MYIHGYLNSLGSQGVTWYPQDISGCLDFLGFQAGHGYPSMFLGFRGLTPWDPRKPTYSWISMDIHGCPWISLGSQGNQMSMYIHVYSRYPMVYLGMRGRPCIHGYPWRSMTALGSQGYQISMDVHGYPWISMDIHAYPWISMDILRLP